MISDAEVIETADVYQQTLLDVFQRRAVWEALENCAIGKTFDMTTLRLLTIDYVGSQLADLRKFFDQDPKAHQVRALTALLSPESKARSEHKRLFVQWNSNYRDVANQYYLHRQKGYINPGSISKLGLNKFMEEMDAFMHMVVQELTEAGHNVPYLERGTDTNYINEIRSSAGDFFKIL